MKYTEAQFKQFAEQFCREAVDGMDRELIEDTAVELLKKFVEEPYILKCPFCDKVHEIENEYEESMDDAWISGHSIGCERLNIEVGAYAENEELVEKYNEAVESILAQNKKEDN